MIKFYFNMQINYSFDNLSSPPCMLYNAQKKCKFAPPPRTFLQLVGISERSEAAALHTTKAGEQRCFPAEQLGRDVAPWHGGQPIVYPGMVSFVRQRFPDVKCVPVVFSIPSVKEYTLSPGQFLPTIHLQKNHTTCKSQISVFDAYAFSLRL